MDSPENRIKDMRRKPLDRWLKRLFFDVVFSRGVFRLCSDRLSRNRIVLIPGVMMIVLLALMLVHALFSGISTSLTEYAVVLANALPWLLMYTPFLLGHLHARRCEKIQSFDDLHKARHVMRTMLKLLPYFFASLYCGFMVFFYCIITFAYKDSEDSLTQGEKLYLFLALSLLPCLLAITWIRAATYHLRNFPHQLFPIQRPSTQMEL